MKDLWSISTSEFAGDKESIMRRGNVYQIANGYMGYRGTLDEFGSEEAVGITLAGIFDRVGSAWREPVNAPNGEAGDGIYRAAINSERVEIWGLAQPRVEQDLIIAPILSSSPNPTFKLELQLFVEIGMLS